MRQRLGLPDVSWRRAMLAGLFVWFGPLGRTARGEPVTSTTPNIENPNVVHPWGVDFVFAHQFYDIGPKVLNSPTFLLALGLPWHLELAARYATSSDIAGRVNELEAFGKLALFAQARGQPLDLSLVAAYNKAANSGDGAVVLARQLGFISVLAIGKGFTAGFGYGGPTVAAGVGLQIHLNRWVVVEGDVNRVLAARYWQDIRQTSDKWNWSAGIGFRIPYSPHTMTLYATNGNTLTLEGSSRGTSSIRFGFNFEIPFDGLLGRAEALVHPPPEAEASPATSPAPAPPGGAANPAAGASNVRTVDVAIENYAYGPATVSVPAGTTVRWINRDPMAHTATASDGTFDSGNISPDGTWTHRFDTPGSYPYICTLHPYMHGTVVVTGKEQSP
jgi:plastocyanin